MRKCIVNRIVILLLSVCGATEAVAQTTVYEDLAKAEMKYWKLRARLRGDERNYTTYPGAMRIGNQQGMGFVPMQRNNCKHTI
jgi:hypothetical protein